MIRQVLRSYQHLFRFSTSIPPESKKIGTKVVRELPDILIPIKPRQREQQYLDTKDIYEAYNYKRKDRLPNCKYFAAEYRNRIYHFFNAYFYPMGRMISRVASAIRGKNSPHFRRYKADIKNGDICVIVNIEDPLVTGKKLLFKKFRYHTGFVGHLKQFSYNVILNKKPELLYHHMLRRMMPKNKLSEKYFQNLILVRGPIHKFDNFPQFSPERRDHESLSQINVKETIKNNPNITLVEESSPGLAERIFGKKFKNQNEKTEEELQKEREAIENLNEVYEEPPRYKEYPTITQSNYRGLKARQRRVQSRYVTARAPFRKRAPHTGLEMFRSQKKARKHPLYELMKEDDFDESQDDDDGPFPNPHLLQDVDADPQNPFEPKKK